MILLRLFLFALLLGSVPAITEAQVESVPLRTALEEEWVSVEIHCLPAQSTSDFPRARVRVRNLITKRIKVRFDEVWLITPRSGDRDSWADPQPNVRRQQLKHLAVRVVDRQPGLVGPVDGRGGVSGSQVVILEPGQIRDVMVPFLGLTLSKFRPDPEVEYEFAASPRWQKRELLQRLIAHLPHFGVSRGVLQTALWQLLYELPAEELQELKPREANQRERLMADYLVALLPKLRPQRDLPLLPARIHVHLINKVPRYQRWSNQLTDVILEGSLLGLPTAGGVPEEKNFEDTPSKKFALACQVTLQGPVKKLHALVLLRDYREGKFQALREIRIPLAEELSPEQAFRKIDQALVQEFVHLVAPAEESPLANSEVLWLENHFPLSLHRLELTRDNKQRGGPVRRLILSGYALGPERKLELPLGGSPQDWQITGAAWGY